VAKVADISCAFTRQEIAMSEFPAVTRHGLYLAALIATAVPSVAQTTAAGNADSASGPTVTIQPLTKYALADGTASVMLPDGWRVTQTGVAFIRAEGQGRDRDVRRHRAGA
jgi:hypothetical protein